MRLAGWLCALLAALALAGCDDLGLPGAGSSGSGNAPARSIPPKPPTRISVGGVVVSAPPGYCVDKRARRGNFVLLAACSAISQSPALPAPGRIGLLTATIGKSGSGATPVDPGQLAAYFRSAAGRATLSYAGDPATVEITDTRARGGTFLLALTDSAKPPRPELGRARWRGFFTVNGRLVSVILHSLREEPMSRTAGLDLLQRFVARIRADSAAAGPGRAG